MPIFKKGSKGGLVPSSAKPAGGGYGGLPPKYADGGIIPPPELDPHPQYPLILGVDPAAPKLDFSKIDLSPHTVTPVNYSPINYNPLPESSGKGLVAYYKKLIALVRYAHAEIEALRLPEDQYHQVIDFIKDTAQPFQVAASGVHYSMSHEYFITGVPIYLEEEAVLSPQWQISLPYDAYKNYGEQKFKKISNAIAAHTGKLGVAGKMEWEVDWMFKAINVAFEFSKPVSEAWFMEHVQKILDAELCPF